MSSETAGPGAPPASSKGARVSFGIVVSTRRTLTLRVERLDASTALIAISGRSSEPLTSWLEAVVLDVIGNVPRPGPAVADDLRAAAVELLPSSTRRRKDA